MDQREAQRLLWKKIAEDTLRKQKKNDDIGRKLQRDKEFRKKKQAERAAMKEEMKVYYAGIGSRETPDYILVLMEQLAVRLREDRMILRTGHAPGADQAFERGAGSAAQIFLPWRSFEQDTGFIASRDENGDVWEPTIFDDPSSEAVEVSAEYHPNWFNLSFGARQLHARNAHQILGPKPLSFPTPVEFVICWTSDGTPRGGTGQAIRIAESLDIPVYNLFDESTYDMAFEWAWGG
jgi:hypothetical protein